jgi:hypothetical protein
VPSIGIAIGAEQVLPCAWVGVIQEIDRKIRTAFFMAIGFGFTLGNKAMLRFYQCQ